MFKHELTHFGETSELYQDFVDNIRTSSVYLEWLQAKTGNNINSVGKLEGVYRDMVIESRKSVAPVGFAEAQQEMYADFCGDVLFSNNQNALNRLMDSLDKKERPKFIQFILDFITYLKEKIAGNKQITLELVKLENQFAQMLNNAKENTDQKGGVRYDADGVIDLSKDNELSQMLTGVFGAEKYKTIQKYILEVLSNQPIKLSDGKKAIVDKSDALHIANKSGTKKTAQINQIKKLVETATLFAEDNDVEHNKFNYFCYYKATVKYGQEIFPIYLNVGRGTNDGKYHIYDITKKIRDTANRINGLERPKSNEGYALENGISKNSISTNEPDVNQEYLTAVNNKDIRYSISSDIDNSDYSGYNTHYGENLKNTPEYLLPTTDREWQVFTRNFANKTNGMKRGERRKISVFTADYQYLIDADGYMTGVICSKVDLNAYEEVDENYDNSSASNVNGQDETNGYRQGDNGYHGRTFEDGREDSFYVELDNFIANHPQFTGDFGEDNRNNQQRVEAERNNSAFSMPENKKYSISTDNAETDNTQHRDIPAEMQRLIQQRDNGEIDADAFTEQMDALYAEANERYGVIPQGENAATPISVPQKVAENKVTRRFVRTILETGKLDAEMIEGIEQEVLLGDIIRTDRYTLILHFAFSILHLYIHRSCVVEDVLLNYACIGFCAVGQNAVKQGLHGTFYPYVLRECICFIKAEKQGAVGNLGADALYFHKLIPCLIKRQGMNFIKINFTACAFLCCIKYVFCTKAAAKRG